jgi:hypothetical protein
MKFILRIIHLILSLLIAPLIPAVFLAALIALLRLLLEYFRAQGRDGVIQAGILEWIIEQLEG